MARGRVLDINDGCLYPEFNIHSILKFGSWESCSMSNAELDALLTGIEELDRWPRRRR